MAGDSGLAGPLPNQLWHIYLHICTYMHHIYIYTHICVYNYVAHKGQVKLAPSQKVIANLVFQMVSKMLQKSYQQGDSTASRHLTIFDVRKNKDNSKIS